MRTINEGQAALEELYRETFGEDGSDHRPEAIALPSSERLSDQEVLELALSARNGEKFRGLWEGDIQGYDSASEADLALVGMLTFYTGGGAEQMDRLYRESGLMREKWDERHFGDGRTYGEGTIDKALEGRTEFYSPQSQSRSLSIEGLGLSGDARVPLPALETDRETQNPESQDTKGLGSGFKAVRLCDHERPAGEQEWIVQDLIPAGYPTTIYAEGGLGKSTLVLHAGLTVAAGFTDWLGFEVSYAPTLYLDLELELETQLRRAYDLAAGMGLRRPPRDFYYASAVAGYDTFAGALEFCIERGVRLIIIDSAGLALEGDSESAKDVLAFFRNFLAAFKEAGVAVLLVDHQAKMVKGDKYANKRPFGSVYKTNLSRSVLQIAGAWDGEKLTTSFNHVKANLGPRVERFSVEVYFEHELISVRKLEHAVEVGAEPNAADKILAALVDSGPLYPLQIAKIAGLEEKTVRNRLSDLRREGRVENTGEMRDRVHQVRIAPADSEPNIPF